ncbi:MAG: ABC transporter ATP-binding protein [Treponema sp.]|nr:ABC transporter ATP-binding protein [Treponema sp.]
MKLQVNNLTAAYKNHTVLNNLSFNINSGDFICLCGPNGCGKSTLLSCLANLQNESLKISDDTSILLDNQEIKKIKTKELAKHIAFMQQSEYCSWDFSVEDFVLQGRYCHSQKGIYSKEDLQIVYKNLSLLGIMNLAQKNLHQISGGEFQKVRLARALSQEPDFLLLDEAANNLDFSFEPKLMEFLSSLSKNQNIGIILSIHNLNLASQFGENIILLTKNSNQNQKMFHGNAKNVFTKENLKDAFNQDFTLYEHPINKSIQIY